MEQKHIMGPVWDTQKQISQDLCQVGDPEEKKN